MITIGKGSRFRVLTGDYRGREGVIVGGVVDRPEWWRIDLGDGDIVEVSPGDIAGLQRLADAPAPADPMFAEVEATIARLQILPGEDAENALDMVASIAGEAARDGYFDDGLRKVLLECAAYCTAGIRDIDRGTT